MSHVYYYLSYLVFLAQKFRAQLEGLLVVWLMALLAFVVAVVLINFIPSAFAGFSMSSAYTAAMGYAVYKSALWLIPAAFLALALYLTNPRNGFLQS